MPRIQGVDIPPDKPAHISLRYIRGLGPTTSLLVCELLNIDPQRRAKDLTDAEIGQIAALLDKDPRFVVEGPLRRLEGANIARLKEIKCYRGERHRKNLPCRGQRTKTNARTRKGPRKTVAGKKGVKDLR
jgi:small subunit ribosomal protein S13